MLRLALRSPPRFPRTAGKFLDAQCSLVNALRMRCTTQPSTPEVPVLHQLPLISPRKQRIQQHGLIAMSADFTKQKLKQQQGDMGAPDEAFRVQTYTVQLARPAEFAVKAVYGFGRSRSKWLAAEVGVFGHCKLSRMRESQRAYIRRALNAACIAYNDRDKSAGAALRKEIGLDIQRVICSQDANRPPARTAHPHPTTNHSLTHWHS